MKTLQKYNITYKLLSYLVLQNDLGFPVLALITQIISFHNL